MHIQLICKGIKKKHNIKIPEMFQIRILKSASGNNSGENPNPLKPLVIMSI